MDDDMMDDMDDIGGGHDGYNHHESRKPLPQSPNWSGDNPWLPKTDWSRDGIIANDD